MTTSRKKAFTLTELLIVLAILAILAVIAIPVVSGLLKKGNDTSEDVNAAYFTSIMQKYAVEEVDTAAHYPRLSTSGGSNSEYYIFSKKAGQGTFPGYNIIANTGNAEALAKIRKEAVIAIKAFGDTAVSDDYFIPPPADDEYEYVYYYLTGDVKKVKRDDLNTTSADELLNGVINVSDYWVYLSRDGGSGAALGGVDGDTGFLFVQVLQYGTGEPLTGASVTVSAGAKTFSATTAEGQKGFVGFSGVPVGSVNVSVSYPGAVTFPNRSFYSKTGEVVISGTGYEGCQMNCPYIVELKLGSLGSLGFYEEKVEWNGSGWSETRTKITTNTTVTSRFTANTSLTPSARSETYTSNLRTTGGTQDLLTSDKYLIYGHYNLLVSAYGYRTYNEAVEAKVFGIDNAEGKYSGYSSPYEYPVVMKSPAGQSTLIGYVQWENASQPLRGTPSGLTGTWVNDNTSVSGRVKVTNIASGTAYYSDYFTAPTEGKYYYGINNLPDGEYKFELDTPYKYVNMSNFPETFTVDGRLVSISGQVKKTEAGNGAVMALITYDYRGNYDPIPGATVKMKRLGESAFSANSVTNANGLFTSPALKNGFYQITVTVPSNLGGSTYYFKIFVSGTEAIAIRLPIAQKTVSGTISLYFDDTTKMTKSGTVSSSSLTVTFKRTNSAGTANQSTTYATVTVNGVDPTYTINLVPGYYIVTASSKCYETYTSSVISVTANKTHNFNMYVDHDDALNHYDLVQKSDASGHWNGCENCGAIFDFEPHTKSNWTFKNTSQCYRYCTVCEYVTDGPSDHTMTSYVSKAATCTTNGTRTYYCTRGCGHTYTETIAKSGHVGNGIWVYDNNGSASSKGTHHQNCKNCGVVMNANTACTRGGMIANGQTNHYDQCSVCSGKRYFNHTWTETSRTGYVCTGGTIYYKCNTCGATKLGSYAATEAHNFRASCNTFHNCSWNTYCTAKGVHVWNGYYHIMCTRCAAVDDSKWCAMHCGTIAIKWPCPY